MVNKKGIILVFVVAALLLNVIGCNKIKDVVATDNPEKNVVVADNPGGGMNVSKVESFPNVKELKKNVEETVRLKVLSSETIEYGDMHFTISKAEILKVYKKGDLVEGSIVKLTQTGAIIDGRDYSISGDPIYRPGDEMLLFLKKCEVPYAEDVYRSLGGNDGRFDVKDSKIIARGFGYGDKSKTKDKVKKSDPIEEMNFDVINELGFTVEEFEEKIK